MGYAGRLAAFATLASKFTFDLFANFRTRLPEVGGRIFQDLIGAGVHDRRYPNSHCSCPFPSNYRYTPV